MDKKAIKNFAIEARKKLINDIIYHASLLGITSERIIDPVKKAEGMEVYDIGGSNPYTIFDDTIELRKNLVQQIKEKGFDNVVEEVAYTWFNRIIAVRFMEVNNYLPTNVRVLSSEIKDKIEPDIVTEAPDIDLDFSEEEKENIYQLKDENQLDELFRLLFIKQCNNLNEILPELFEKTSDYTEILFSISFTDKDSIIRQLIDLVDEIDFFGQVEIIGWLYQYYNTELKNTTFKELKRGIKIRKERIPAATQLYTPDWIVRYMVENSLGRLWLEKQPETKIKENWKYFLEEPEQEQEVQLEIEKIRKASKNLKPSEIKIIDPAIGSGHIIIYAFEVLMDIYTSVGYTEKDAALSILKHNIYGLDIDNRAYQLALFAVLMKARAYDKNILEKSIRPQILPIQESGAIKIELIDFIANGDINIKNNLEHLIKIFADAKNLGSLIKVTNMDFNIIINRIKTVCNSEFQDFKSIKLKKDTIEKIVPIIKQAIILSQKYDVVITNPPYMGHRSMNKNLSAYLKSNYPNSKTDLFAAFIEKCQCMVSDNRYVAMITQQAFMFLSSYEKLRRKFLEKTIVNMIQLGARAFEEIGGEVVQTTSFILQNNNISYYKANYIDLVNLNSQKKKEMAFFNEDNLYVSIQEQFQKIPGSPIAYWISENASKISEESKKFEDYANTRAGMITGNNELFIRLWYEISISKMGIGLKTREEAINSQKKWFPYNKGGEFRKWYGNNEYVVNWENDGFFMRNLKDKSGKIPAHAFNLDYIFKENVTWNSLSSYKFAARYTDFGFLYDASGSFADVKNDLIKYTLAFLCSIVTFYFLSAMNPTLNFQKGNISNLPFVLSKEHKNRIDKLVSYNINISKRDWDNFETSWGFKVHPFIQYSNNTEEIDLCSAFLNWDEFTKNQFSLLKTNEEELNRIFIEIYNLHGDLNPEVDNKDVTIRRANLERDIKSLISYAVGCIFGRYSLDEEGLIFAGGPWDHSKYKKLIPDDDNIIPILDNEYFEDDIVGKFIEFIKLTFGEKNLEKNLDFIAEVLKKRGTTSREIIRNYFLTDFYKDHLKTYKKRPIYWLFDSGRNNGFKALIYMHRYEPDLVARVRIDYLHKTQKALETAIANNERILENSTNATEKAKAVKARDKLVKQLEETRQYDLALAHVANQKIEIDLDDGVKVNYAKFQGVQVSTESKITKINLLKKI